jgi:hypothetical protein
MVFIIATMDTSRGGFWYWNLQDIHGKHFLTTQYMKWGKPTLFLVIWLFSHAHAPGKCILGVYDFGKLCREAASLNCHVKCVFWQTIWLRCQLISNTAVPHHIAVRHLPFWQFSRCSGDQQVHYLTVPLSGEQRYWPILWKPNWREEYRSKISNTFEIIFLVRHNFLYWNPWTRNTEHLLVHLNHFNSFYA